MSEQDTSIAARLRRARESRGETLDQAHQRTGISTTLLKGLESGKLDVVETVYMRLAVVAYAEYLGLDAADMAKQFDDEPGTRAALSSATGMARRPGESSFIHGLRTMGRSMDGNGLFRLPQSLLIALGGAILLVLILIAAWLDGGGSSDASQERPSAEVAREDAAPSSAATTTLSPGDEASLDDSLADGFASLRTEPTAATEGDRARPREDIDTSSTASSATGVWGPSSSRPPPTTASLGQLVLEARAVDTTWVQVLWDGANGIEGTIPEGERRRWVARDSFFVRSGIAYGVHFTFQGQLLADGRLGDPSEVLRFRASRNGVVLLGRNLRPIGEPISIGEPIPIAPVSDTHVGPPPDASAGVAEDTIAPGVAGP